MKKRTPSERRAGPKERHGPDWEPSGPEWAPSGRPRDEKPPGRGEPAKKGDEVGPGPAKSGDPPLERPFGERSRHGGAGEPHGPTRK